MPSDACGLDMGKLLLGELTFQHSVSAFCGKGSSLEENERYTEKAL